LGHIQFIAVVLRKADGKEKFVFKEKSLGIYEQEKLEIIFFEKGGDFK